MSKTELSLLLQQRKEQWRVFHQCRRHQPVKAAIARRAALKVEQRLAENGYPVAAS
ncbi:MAG TPA: hypothetical protein V6C88_14950 [Chroococcidiopsis sp.]